jgi:hypothetical protein
VSFVRRQQYCIATSQFERLVGYGNFRFAFEGLNQRIEFRGVFSQSLPGIEAN